MTDTYELPGFPPWPNDAYAYFPAGDGLEMPLYNPAQVEAMMRAYGQECVRVERERCAGVCEQMRAVSAVSYELGTACAAAIRAG